MTQFQQKEVLGKISPSFKSRNFLSYPLKDKKLSSGNQGRQLSPYLFLKTHTRQHLSTDIKNQNEQVTVPEANIVQIIAG